MDSPSNLAQLLDELLMLFRETADYHRRSPEVVAVLGEAHGCIRRLRRRLQWSESSYSIAFVGLSNVGKSTLINALLGDEYAPHCNGPCTPIAIEFRYGESPAVAARQAAKLRPPTWYCKDAAAVRRRLEQLPLEALSGRLEVSAPAGLLIGGLILVDTPGFGAVQFDEEGSHEAALRQYLRTATAQVFWVVLAEQGITAREQAFYRRWLADICDDVIVTGCENWTSAERERFRHRFSEMLAPGFPCFHFVSGTQGTQARRSGDAALWTESGVEALEKRLRDLADVGRRAGTLQEDLVGLAVDLRAWLEGYRDELRRPLRPWWRPDSFARWQAVQANDELKQRLAHNLQEP